MKAYLKYMLLGGFMYLSPCHSSDIEEPVLRKAFSSIDIPDVGTVNPSLFRGIKLSEFSDPEKFDEITSYAWPCVKYMMLETLTITVDMMQAMIDSGFSNVKFFEINTFKIEPDAVDSMLAAEWPNLERLRIINSSTREDSLLKPLIFKKVCERFAPQLKTLEIQNWITIDRKRDAGEVTFHNSIAAQYQESADMLNVLDRPWPLLKKLSLTYCSITSNAVTSLCKENFPSLEKLELRNNELEYEDVCFIISNFLPQLKYLDLCDNDVPSEWTESLCLKVRNLNWPGNVHILDDEIRLFSFDKVYWGEFVENEL